MSDELNTYEERSGVDEDGLGEGEVAFEGEEQWWEDGYWLLQSLLQRCIGPTDCRKTRA